jgi:tetratricopeptide (TPR) repeat protein
MISTPQVYLTQSRLGVIQGDYTSAAQHLREGLIHNPRNPELLEALAEIELRSGHPDRALESLAQIAQLPEKSLPLCEKALRNLANGDRADEGLRLFSPIARELARRGAGDTVSRSLRAALQGHFGSEAWALLADIAHQSGNRAEQIEALQSAFGLAMRSRDQALTSQLAAQLQALGVVPDAAVSAPSAAPPPPTSSGLAQLPAPEMARHGSETELDPVRRLRIEQFCREAEALLRGGSPERAIETYKKALDLDPADLTIIESIVAVHRSTGRLTQVQMQYVQSAQALAALGKTREAGHLLDMAEQLFPGSTRIHRRALGLPEASAAPAAAPRPAPDPFTAAPQPSAPIALPPPSDMDVLIGLDLPGFERQTRTALPEPAAPSFPLAESLPLIPDPDLAIPDPFAVPEPSLELLPKWTEPEPPLPVSAPAVTTGGAADLPWMESAPEDFQVSLPPDPFAPLSVPTELLAPIPTRQLEPEAVEASFLLPPATAPAAVPEAELAGASEITSIPGIPALPEELVSLLGDIDFQLDYGNPEEAKIEIESAFKLFPGHPELTVRMERADEALQKLGHTAKASALDESDFANSFFDLTDVLGTALMDTGEGEEMHDATHVVEKIQSVDELFSAFREGVEKQVKGDDYDTHYNLGIAYKEMMLIEPAIEEFKIAMRDPERTLECCSMLSICEQVRGDLAASVEWLHQGIAAPGFPPEDSVGLRYDLGDLYLQQGLRDKAAEEFRAVYDLDPDYRDVAARLS